MGVCSKIFKMFNQLCIFWNNYNVNNLKTMKIIKTQLKRELQFNPPH